jgi:hypothetical protein
MFSTLKDDENSGSIESFPKPANISVEIIKRENEKNTLYKLKKVNLLIHDFILFSI